MGWSSWIVVDKYKLAVEISRSTEPLNDYEGKSLNELMECGEVDDGNVTVTERQLKDITMGDLSKILKFYDIRDNMYNIHHDKLFMYWLTRRGISYKYLSGDDKLQYFQDEGYMVIHLS